MTKENMHYLWTYVFLLGLCSIEDFTRIVGEIEHESRTDTGLPQE